MISMFISFMSCSEMQLWKNGAAWRQRWKAQHTTKQRDIISPHSRDDQPRGVSTSTVLYSSAGVEAIDSVAMAGKRPRGWHLDTSYKTHDDHGERRVRVYLVDVSVVQCASDEQNDVVDHV
jgi:hypothetical protein